LPGTLSHGLGQLGVAGNRIIDVNCLAPVTLRGINRSGMEYGSPAHAGITAADLERIVCGWGANIVRVPFNQDWALRRAGYDPEPYLAALDFIIETCAALGAYTLLDLQWLDAETVRGRNSDGSNNFVPPLPNLGSIELWRQLAARYVDEPAVLYDIFNEPHDALPDDPVPLIDMRDDGSTFALRSWRVGMEEWRPWAVRLVGAIRSQNPRALIFVSGTNWGYDLRGFPLEGTPGIVYSTHIYRNKGNDWDAAFGSLAANYPVFAAEMGGGADDLEWGASLIDYCAQHNIGWTAWSWSDRPHLIVPPLSPDYRPTAFGEVVRNALTPGTQ
jgi:endoglucanase